MRGCVRLRFSARAMNPLKSDRVIRDKSETLDELSAKRTSDFSCNARGRNEIAEERGTRKLEERGMGVGVGKRPGSLQKDSRREESEEGRGGGGFIINFRDPPPSTACVATSRWRG